MTSPERPGEFAPRLPMLVAAGIFLVVAIAMMYPMFSGQFLLAEDQVIAGYGFRSFMTSHMHATGEVPQWNPYIFGGMPLWAVPGHFDVFYPTSWLRLFVSADTALNLGFFIHLIVAGIAMYVLMRTLRVSWAAAAVAGVGYELTGMVASQLAPGHDGKMFVAALAPLAFAALIHAIRNRRLGAYGGFAVVIGCVMLTPHYQAAYYLLIASGLLTLWLAFVDPERERDRSPWIPLGMAAVAVCVGVGIGMIDMLPTLQMIEYTARAAGGTSGGWEYATSYALPIEEIMSVILPQFNGVSGTGGMYWGQNPVKTHNEYLGALVVVLAILGVGVARRRRLLLPLVGIGSLFLLVAFGGHTPFYQLWWHLPRMSQFRAAGMAFYIVSLCACVLAGLGADALLRGEVKRRTLYIGLGALGMIALLGVMGALQDIAASVAMAGRDQHVAANAESLRAGATRLLAVVVLGGGIMVLIERRLLRGLAAAGALVLAVAADNYSVLRHFVNWLPPAAEVYADDALTIAMKLTPMPFRAYDPSSPDNPDPQARAQFEGLHRYAGSTLMARGVPALFGYHGMESRYFDALFGVKNVWANQLNQNLWDLFAIRYVVLSHDLPPLPGFHRAVGPVSTPGLIAVADSGVLYERDSVTHWVRVVPAAVKVPEEQIIPTVIDQRFPVNLFALFPDTASVQGSGVSATTIPATTAVTPTLVKWAPGAMTVSLGGADTRTTYLLVAENWYPDWHARVDGTEVPTHRANGTMLSVALPPGAREVTLRYDIAAYHTGKVISIIALLLSLACAASGRVRRRTADV